MYNFLYSRIFFSSTDVNVAFQLSAHKVLLDDDNLLPLLHLTIDYHGKEQKGMQLRFFFVFFLKSLAKMLEPPDSGDGHQPFYFSNTQITDMTQNYVL